MTTLNGVTLVTGAAGVLGRATVDALVSEGAPVRGVGRRVAPPAFAGEWFRADLLTGEGLAEALRGVCAVIHCASDPYRPNDDPVALQRLVDAVRQAGASHLVHVGIAGIEQAAARLPYYAAKLACERALVAGDVPHMIVRATQFHSFVAFLLDRLDFRFAVAVPSGVQLQPVAVEYVAARLAYHARSAPAGRAPDVHGPESLGLEELARSWLRARGRRTPLLRVPIHPRPFGAFARLRTVSGDGGGPSWRDWLGIS